MHAGQNESIMTWMGVASALHSKSHDLRLAQEHGGCRAVALQVLRESRHHLHDVKLCPIWPESPVIKIIFLFVLPYA